MESNELARPKEPREYPRHEIRVNPMDHGYLVQVGCKSFAIESKDKLLTYLAMYIDSPEATTKKYMEGKLFDEFEGEPDKN